MRIKPFLLPVAIAAIAVAAYAANELTVNVSSSYTKDGRTASIAKNFRSNLNSTNINIASGSCGTTDYVVNVAYSNAVLTIVSNDPTNAATALKYGAGVSNYVGYVRAGEAVGGVRLFAGATNASGFLHLSSTNGAATWSVLCPPNN